MKIKKRGMKEGSNNNVDEVDLSVLLTVLVGNILWVLLFTHGNKKCSLLVTGNCACKIDIYESVTNVHLQSTTEI